VELAITGAIPDASRYILEVTHLPAGKEFDPR
jgi:hypothetical protein